MSTTALPAEGRPVSDDQAKGLTSRAIRGGAVLLAARLGMQAFTWAVTLYVPRLVGSRDYGVMTWGFIFLGLVEVLAEAGLGRALVQKEDARPADRDRVFTLSLLLAAVLYAILFFGAGPIAAWVRLDEFAVFLQVVGLAVWLVPFRTVSLAILEREQRLNSLAVAHVLMAGLQALLVLVLALAGAGYWALAIGALAGKLVEAVALNVASGWWPRLAWPDRDSRPLIAFGAYVAGGTLLWFLYDNADYAIVGRLLGPQQLGLYSLAFLLMSMPVQKITANVIQVAYPVFCRLQGDPSRLRDWFLRLTVLLGLVGVPALVGLALIADDGIRLVYREKWESAIVPFRLLAFVGIVRLYAAALPPLYNAVGRPDIHLKYTAACLVLLPAAFYVGGTFGGLIGVCVAWLIVYPLVVATLLVLTRPVIHFGLLAFVQAQLPVLTAAAAMAAAVLLVRLAVPPGWLRLMAAIFTGAVTYAGVMLALGRGTVLADVRGLWQELRGSREA